MTIYCIFYVFLLGNEKKICGTLSKYNTLSTLSNFIPETTLKANDLRNIEITAILILIQNIMTKTKINNKKKTYPLKPIMHSLLIRSASNKSNIYDTKIASKYRIPNVNSEQIKISYS